ncbi:MAG: N-acetyl sugar amidotransferase [Bacteroidetes bacterium]|nr:N-acetyl sugar amidotransferase [Bacteroidota bacterium]
MIPSLKLCKRCIMDDARPGTFFDENGYCNHCSEYINKTSKRAYQGEQSDKKLNSIFNKIKESGKGKRYDCLIGISGGVDSCYAAYLAKKNGLRVLTMHLDNGWDSDTSVKNIKYVIDKLGFEYESFVLDWEEFRDLQLSFLKASVPDMENPTDCAIIGSLHKTAVQYGIKYIISGGNYATEGFLPKFFQYNAKDSKYIRAIQKIFGSKPLKTYPFFNWKMEFYYKLVKGIRIVYPLNYVNYSKKESQQLLEKEFTWKYYGGKHYESIYTRFVQGYILPNKFNVDYRKITLSMQIINGEITRDNALEQLKEKPYSEEKSKEDMIYVCKKLGISTDEFNKIMELPPKTYLDYPNEEKFLNFIYTTYKKLGSLYSS